MDGFLCDRCGFVAEGLFAQAVFERHTHECQARARSQFVTWQREISDADRAFLKVQKIVWDE